MSVIRGQEFPRPMTEDEQADARIVGLHLPGVGRYEPGAGIFHWSTGPYWPDAMRRRARALERAIPVLLRMADWLDARQPEEQAPKRDELGRCPCCRMYGRHASGCPSIHNHEEGKL